jgi:hypothetical protein
MRSKMHQDGDSVTPEEIAKLSVRAVNALIADAEAGRLLNNKELAEVIAGCIRHTDAEQLRTLKQLLDQHKLERPEAEEGEIT